MLWFELLLQWSFCLAINWSSLCFNLPRRQGGQETDFILISCTGGGLNDDDREKVLKAKQVRHEGAFLKFVGLGHVYLFNWYVDFLVKKPMSLDLESWQWLCLWCYLCKGGEAALRNSGLGYTIIRPGPLQVCKELMCYVWLLCDDRI